MHNYNCKFAKTMTVNWVGKSSQKIKSRVLDNLKNKTVHTRCSSKNKTFVIARLCNKIVYLTGSFEFWRMISSSDTGAKIRTKCLKNICGPFARTHSRFHINLLVYFVCNFYYLFTWTNNIRSSTVQVNFDR